MADNTKKDDAKISIKVIVDKVKKRAVYAEADHTFVDILFSFMTLPMGTIVRLLGKLEDSKFEPLRSLNNLYGSLKDFPDRYFSKHRLKSMLLNPRSLLYARCKRLKLKIDDTEPMQCFKCGKRPREVFNFVRLLYDSDSYQNLGVFVSDIPTFIVTDDLCVMPFTCESSIRLLTDLGITDKNRVEEIQVDLDSEEMLYVLKMALSNDSVLTHLVFQRSHPIRDLVVQSKSSTFESTDLDKKEESVSLEFHFEVILQKSTGKLIFVETTEAFVEFLFGFLSIPLGTVVGHLMNGASSITCMDNIFKSITNLSVGRYFMSQDTKDLMLKPHVGQQLTSKNQLFCLEGTPLFHCNRCSFKETGLDGRLLIQTRMFIVTDELIITPSSSFTIMNILNDLKVPFDDIEKVEISIGISEGLKILKASLRSCSTLSDSFEHLLRK